MAGRFDQPAETPQGGNAEGFSKGFRPVPTVNYGAVKTPGVDKSQALQKQAANASARADGIRDAGNLNMIATGIEGLGRVAGSLDNVVQENISQEVSEGMESLEKQFFGIPTSQDASSFAGAPEGLRNEVAKNDALVQASSTRTQVGGHFESRVLANMRQMQRKYPGWADVVEKHFTSRLGQNPRTAVIREAQRSAREAKASATADEKFRKRMILKIAENPLYAADVPGLTADNATEVLGSMSNDRLMGIFFRQEQYIHDQERANLEAEAAEADAKRARFHADQGSAGIVDKIVSNSVDAIISEDPDFIDPATGTKDLSALKAALDKEWDNFEQTGDPGQIVEASKAYSEGVDTLKAQLVSFLKSNYKGYAMPANDEYVRERVDRAMEPLYRIRDSLAAGDIDQVKAIAMKKTLVEEGKRRKFQADYPEIYQAQEFAKNFPDEAAGLKNSIARKNHGKLDFKSWVFDHYQDNLAKTTINPRNADGTSRTQEQVYRHPGNTQVQQSGIDPYTGGSVNKPGERPMSEVPLENAETAIEHLEALKDPEKIENVARFLFEDGSLIENIRPEVRRKYFNKMTDDRIASKMSVSTETQKLYADYLAKAFVDTNLLSLRDVSPEANSFWETMQVDFDPNHGWHIRPDLAENANPISAGVEMFSTFMMEELAPGYSMKEDVRALNLDYLRMRRAAISANIDPDSVSDAVLSYEWNRQHPEYTERKGRLFTRVLRSMSGSTQESKTPESTKIQGRLGGEEENPFQ